MNLMRVLSDIDVFGKRVLVRADLDVPLREARATNDKRLTTNAEQATRLINLKPTVDYLLMHGAKRILIAGHIDRPSPRLRGGKPVIDPALSTEQLLEPLEKILGQKIAFSEDLMGPVSRFPPAFAKASAGMPASSVSAALPLEAKRSGVVGIPSPTATPKIFLLENLRFWPGEVENDLKFAKELAQMAEVYVNEAFGNCHRNHASMVGVPAFLAHAAGLHLEKEVEVLTNLLKNPERPFVAVVGGAKIETKAPVVENLARIADHVLVGGEIALAIAKNGQKFPQNVLIASLASHQKDISNSSMIRIIELIRAAKTLVWNGPMGVFEEGFDSGSRAVAQAIIDSKAFSVVGGGETTQFLAQAGLLSKFSFVSAGGGAMLEFLAGRKLVALSELE